MIRLDTNSEDGALPFGHYRCLRTAWGLSPFPPRSGSKSISKPALSRNSLFCGIRVTVRILCSTTKIPVGRIQLP
jgi:hypothetical protein